VGVTRSIAAWMLALGMATAASAQEMRGPERLVAQLAVGPGPVVLHEEDLRAADLVGRARFELGADGERRHEL